MVSYNAMLYTDSGNVLIPWVVRAGRPVRPSEVFREMKGLVHSLCFTVRSDLWTVGLVRWAVELLLP